MELLEPEVLKQTDNPFKFLEAYTKEDESLFEGRDIEIEQLYEMLFSKNIILVYGESGVGKTSLIQCGLANRFKTTDWYDVWITRKDNINQSLRDALIEKAGVQKEKTREKSIPELVQLVYLRYFKPVYLIIDQLEELFVNGTSEEREQFLDTIELILEGKFSCKVILVIQEKFHSSLHECEDRGIPMFQSALKVNRMDPHNAQKAVIASLKNTDIEIPNNDYESISKLIVNACTENDKVHLPSLQVFLYKLWEKAAQQQKDKPGIRFNNELVQEAGKIENVLQLYLTDAVTEIADGKEGSVWLFLQHFISEEETKKSLRLTDIHGFAREDTMNWITHLIEKKIIKPAGAAMNSGEKDPLYTLTHDSLVPLIKSFRGRSSRPRLADPPLKGRGNPYKGLFSYDEQDSDRFFGRKRVIAELGKRIKESRLLAIVGASGTGKSSLIKAGILPGIKKDGYLIIAEKPTANPDKVIAKIKSKFEENPLQQKFVVYIDQFEELSSQCEDAKERERFLAYIRELLEENDTISPEKPKDIKILLSIRSDYEHEFDRSLKDWRSSKILIPPFLEEEIREIIVEPAYNAGLEYQPFYLVDIIVKEVMQSNGSLPLLSYTLSQMYQEYAASKRDDGMLTESDYNKIGGVVDGLRSRANEIYNASDDAKKRTIRNVMLRMVSLGIGDKAGKRILESELEYDLPAENMRVKEVVSQFVDKWLVVSGKDEKGNTFYEPAHDSLVRAWDMIAEWIEVYGKEILYLQRNLSEAVIDYKKYNKLWHEDPRLDTLKRILNSDNNWLNKEETEFVTKSIRRRQELIDRARRKQQEELERTKLLSAALADKLQEKDEKEKILNEKLYEQKLKEELIQKSKYRLIGWLLLLAIFAVGSTFLGIRYFTVANKESKAKKEVTKEKNIADSARTAAEKEKQIADSLRLKAEEYAKLSYDISVTSKENEVEAKRNEKKAIAEKERADKIAKNNAVLAVEKAHALQLADERLSLLEEKNKNLNEALDDLKRADEEKLQFGMLKERSGKRVTLIQKYRESDPALAYQIAETGAGEDPDNIELSGLLNTLQQKNGYFESFVKDNVTSAFFTNDGNMMISVSDKNTIDIWGMDGNRIGGFTEAASVSTVEVSPDGKQILTVADNTVKLHTIHGQFKQTLLWSGEVLKAFYATTGNVIVILPNSIEMFSLSGVNKGRIHTKTDIVIEASADDKYILVKSSDRVEFFDQKKNTRIGQLKNKESYLLPGAKGVLSFEPIEGKVKYHKVLIYDNTGNIRKAGKEIYQLNDPLNQYKMISWLSYSNDLSKIAILISPEFRQQQQQQQQQQQSVKNYFMDENTIEPSLYLLDRNEKKLAQYNEPIKSLQKVILSPDGAYLMTGESAQIVIYGIGGNLVSSFGSYALFNNWSFHPTNRKIILTRDGERIKIWMKGTATELDRQKRLKKYTPDELKKLGVE